MLSWREQLTYRRPKRSCLFSSYEIVTKEDTAVDGRVVKQSVIRTVIPSEQFKGLKASDFALDNLIAAGAVDMLKSCQLHDVTLDKIDDLDYSVANLISSIDSNAQEEKITEE